MSATNNSTREERRKYQEEIFRILSLFLNVNDAADMVNTTPFFTLHWFPALTHVTYEANEFGHYETLETLGDSGIKYTFTRYLILHYPKLDPLRITEIRTHYLSNEYMKDLVEKLGLVELIRVRGGIGVTDKMKADVFEAFCGAIVSVGDKVELGKGIVYLYEFTKYLFKDVKFDALRAMGSEITQTQQIFQIVGGDPPQQKSGFDEKERETWYQVTFSKRSMEALKKLKGVRVPDETKTFTVRRPYKDEAKHAAYSEAFNYLNDIGVTSQRVKSYRNSRLFSHEKIKPFIHKALERAREEGFATLTYDQPKKYTSKNEGFVMILQGVEENGYKTNLLVGAYPMLNPDSIRTDEEVNARADLLKRYGNYDDTEGAEGVEE